MMDSATTIASANLQWHLADALAVEHGFGGMAWHRMEGGWYDTHEAPTREAAMALVRDLKGAHIHAVPMSAGNRWWVEADLRSRDAYPISRAERDAVARVMLDARNRGCSALPKSVA